MTDTVDKIIIQSETRGVQQTTNEVQGLSRAMDGVSVASEKVERSSISVENKFASLERRLGTTAAQARQFEKDQKTINDAVAQNPAFAARAADAQAALAARYVNAAKASEEFTKSTGLTRHELINLSRQAQDVVVSLQGGQSLSTVFLQQGSQILDVLGTSQGGIRGSLAALGTSLRSVVTVGRVAFAGIAAAAGGAAFATASYLSEQKNVERSLIGAGRRSASRGDINQIADSRSSLTGLSVSEAREAALEFAKTGQIHSRVIGEMVDTTRNFALVTGQSSKEAAAALAGAFTNIQGIDNLNKQFNFLDASTRRTVENLLLAGRTTEAAALANSRLSVSLKEVESTQGAMEKGWTAIGNAISIATSKLGEYAAKGLGLQAPTKLDRASDIASEIERRQSKIDRGDFNNILGDTTQLDRAKASIEDLRAKLRELYSDMRAGEKQATFNALSVSAAQAVAATNPLQASLDAVVGKLTMLRDAQAQGINIPGLQMALTYYQQIAEQLSLQMQAQDALAAKYPGMTAEFAKQVNALEDQNRLLKARENGTEASVSAAIAYENAIEQGANQTEAAAIKALTLKNNLLQAASAASSIQINLDWTEFDAYVSQIEAYQRDPNTRSFLSSPATMPSGDFALVNPFLPSSIRQGAWSSPGLFAPNQLSSMINAAIDESNRDLHGEAYARDFRYVGTDEDVRGALNVRANELLGSDNRQERLQGMQMQLDALTQQYPTQTRLAEIDALKRAMEKLRNAVDENTDALTKVTLNPLYTEGRSAMPRLGYMHAAKGLDFIAQGPTTGDQVHVPLMVNGGERVIVQTKEQQAASNDNRMTINNNIVIAGPASTSRRNERQLGQKYGQLMASLS